MIWATGYGSSSIDGFPIGYIYAAMFLGFVVYMLVLFFITIREEIQYRRDEVILAMLDESESKDRHG